MSLRGLFYNIIMYPIITKTRKKVNEVIVSLDPQSIIDICCGTGTQLKSLVKMGYNAIGVDSTEEMLEVARKGKYQPECYQQDAENLKFPDESFDVSLLSLALHEKELETAKRMVKEARRVLKKGKYLIIVEFCLTKETRLLSKSLIYFIEKVSGKEHYGNFINYKENQLIEEMICKKDFEIVTKHNLSPSGLEIRVYRKL
ncbi:MAG: putative methyltransferase YcgJ [Firmicutes bacterium ADurb.Bin419]|nr:MAG: putative methyltransferase YcgJ [Firmicutes bacterium ADurb.Bin419]